MCLVDLGDISVSPNRHSAIHRAIKNPRRLANGGFFTEGESVLSGLFYHLVVFNVRLWPVYEFYKRHRRLVTSAEATF